MRITDKRETAVYTDVVERNVDYIIIVIILLFLLSRSFHVKRFECSGGEFGPGFCYDVVGFSSSIYYSDQICFFFL